MRQFIIPEIFFKSIAEKGKLYSRIWFFWLSEHPDELFDLDFLEKQATKFPDKKSEIREIYEFGIQLLRQDFKILNPKQKKARKPVNKELKKIAENILEYLNNKASTTFTTRGTNLDLIVARLEEGYMINDFYTVIDKKVRDWKGTDWEKYIRPLTLFSKSKFDNYLNSQNESVKTNEFTKFTESIIKASQQLNSIRKK